MKELSDNEKLIVKLKEQQNRLDNSSLDNEIESLPKPKDSEELENQLVEYRAQLQSQPTQDFINIPPLVVEGNPMNYDSDIAKGNTDRDFDEMNPFADQELDNIQKEINNMEANNATPSVFVKCQNKNCQQDLLVPEDLYRIFCSNCNTIFVAPKHFGLYHKLDVLHFFS